MSCVAGVLTYHQLDKRKFGLDKQSYKQEKWILENIFTSVNFNGDLNNTIKQLNRVNDYFLMISARWCIELQVLRQKNLSKSDHVF